MSKKNSNLDLKRLNSSTILMIQLFKTVNVFFINLDNKKDKNIPT